MSGEDRIYLKPSDARAGQKVKVLFRSGAFDRRWVVEFLDGSVGLVSEHHLGKVTESQSPTSAD